MTVRVTFLFNKRADISYDEFNAYWSQNGQLLSSLSIVKQNILKYSQFHFDRKSSEAMRAAGVGVAEFDGAGELWANSLEDIMAVFSDPEYIKVVVPDESKFVDRESGRIIVGHEELKHEKNSV